MTPARDTAYRDLGLKLTPQRLAVLEVLEGNTTHPSAEDVYRAVRIRFPTMSFATVYNTLETLKRRGRIIELTADPVKKRFDPNTTPHHHAICSCCSRIVDVMEEIRLETAGAAFSGFKITGHHVEFIGICPDCQNTRKPIQKG